MHNKVLIVIYTVLSYPFIKTSNNIHKYAKNVIYWKSEDHCNDKHSNTQDYILYFFYLSEKHAKKEALLTYQS